MEHNRRRKYNKRYLVMKANEAPEKIWVPIDESDML